MSVQVASRKSIRRLVRLTGFFVVTGGTVVAAVLVGPLASVGALGGLVGLELIGDAEGARRLIEVKTQWSLEAGRPAILEALRWDLVLIAAYSLGLYLDVRLIFPLFRLQSIRSTTRVVAFAALVPGTLDLVANGLLWVGLTRQPLSNGWFLAVVAVAYAKFLTLAVLSAALVAGVASGLTTRNRDYRRLYNPVVARQVPAAVMPNERRLGLALSGGGVRAASVSLGALQELENPPGAPGAGLGWKDAENITAVSGGAYMGGAWQLGRHAPGSQNEEAWRKGKIDATEIPGPEEQHLIANLGYLTTAWPRGRPNEPGSASSRENKIGTDTPNLDKPVHNINRRRPAAQAAASVVSQETALAQRIRNSASFWVTLLVGFGVNLTVLAAAIAATVGPLGLAFKWLGELGNRCSTEGQVPPAFCLVQRPAIWVPPLAWIVIGLLLAFLWVCLGKLPKLRTWRPLLVALRISTFGALAVGAALLVLLLGFPLLVGAVGAANVAAVGAAAAALLTTGASIFRIVRKQLIAIAPKLGGIAFAVLLLLVAALVAEATWVNLTFTATVTAWSIICALLLLTWLLFSPELWSMFAFYRGRLRAAYALRRDADDPGNARHYVNDGDEDPNKGYLQEPQLDEIKDSKLTICSSAHASTKAIRTHYRIPAMSFTWSPKEISLFLPEDDLGGTHTYTVSTTAMQNVYQGAGMFTTRRLTTFFAVALSGAAIAPAMGRFRIGPTSMLITFANLRLGGWMPNPRYISQEDATRVPRLPFPMVRLGYLFKEFIGLHDPTDLFVYVSDGGHWENSGLVELLRGRPVATTDAQSAVDSQASDDTLPTNAVMPNEVVLIDADAGHAATVTQLAQAIELAKLECNVDIFIDLESLRAFPNMDGGPTFAERSVALGLIRKQQRWGLLWYGKPALTKVSPAPLLSHREVDEQFPSTTTLNQFFDTSTYFAYRNIGRYNAAEIRLARQKLREFLGKPLPADWLAGDLSGEHWVITAFARLVSQQPERSNGSTQSPRQSLLDDIRMVLNSEPAGSELRDAVATDLEPHRRPLLTKSLTALRGRFLRTRGKESAVP